MVSVGPFGPGFGPSPKLEKGPFASNLLKIILAMETKEEDPVYMTPISDTPMVDSPYYVNGNPSESDVNYEEIKIQERGKTRYEKLK